MKNITKAFLILVLTVFASCNQEDENVSIFDKIGATEKMINDLVEVDNPINRNLDPSPPMCDSGGLGSGAHWVVYQSGGVWYLWHSGGENNEGFTYQIPNEAAAIEWCIIITEDLNDI